MQKTVWFSTTTTSTITTTTTLANSAWWVLFSYFQGLFWVKYCCMYLEIYTLFLPKIASFVYNSEPYFISQQNLYCLLTGGAVVCSKALASIGLYDQFIIIFGDFWNKVVYGKQDNLFFRHHNQWESICTNLTFESAQIKHFSRLLVCTYSIFWTLSRA